MLEVAGGLPADVSVVAKLLPLNVALESGLVFASGLVAMIGVVLWMSPKIGSVTTLTCCSTNVTISTN